MQSSLPLCGGRSLLRAAGTRLSALLVPLAPRSPLAVILSVAKDPFFLHDDLHLSPHCGPSPSCWTHNLCILRENHCRYGHFVRYCRSMNNPDATLSHPPSPADGGAMPPTGDWTTAYFRALQKHRQKARAALAAGQKLPVVIRRRRADPAFAQHEAEILECLADVLESEAIRRATATGPIHKPCSDALLNRLLKIFHPKYDDLLSREHKAFAAPPQCKPQKPIRAKGPFNFDTALQRLEFHQWEREQAIACAIDLFYMTPEELDALCPIPRRPYRHLTPWPGNYEEYTATEAKPLNVAASAAAQPRSPKPSLESSRTNLPLSQAATELEPSQNNPATGCERERASTSTTVPAPSPKPAASAIPTPSTPTTPPGKSAPSAVPQKAAPSTTRTSSPTPSAALPRSPIPAPKKRRSPIRGLATPKKHVPKSSHPLSPDFLSQHQVIDEITLRHFAAPEPDTS